MSDSDYDDPKVTHLENLFSYSKPKSRYIAELHVEDQNGSIAKEIVNGDIEVRKKKGNLDLPHEKNDYEEMLRRKFIQQFAKEKEELAHRLGYVENSLIHLEKFQYLRKRSLLESNLGASRRSQDWRREHQEEMRRLESKKKEIAMKSKEKEDEIEQVKAKVVQEERAKKKAELLDSIKKVKERTEKRNETAKEEKQKLKELFSRKQLHDKIEERYKEKEQSILQERKKKLAEIRQLKKPINMQEILEHEQKVLEILKEKDNLRNREIRMNSSRARAYKPSYQSAFYKQLSVPQDEQPEENPKHKLQKMRQFSEQVKTKYIPEIDENKRKEMEDRLQNQIKVRVQRQEKEQQLIQKPKLKGLQYLQLMKKLPKKRQDSSKVGVQTQRIAYQNYLGSRSVDMGKPQTWKNILTKGQNKVQTAQLLQFQSERLEEQLKRKEQYGRVMKIKDDGSIDQQYYQMVKAKLSLLAKE